MGDTPISVIVAGSLNVDIVCSGVDEIARRSGDTTAEPLRIEPGGKGRNIAAMISHVSERGVAMLGRISEDPYGLWEVPVSSLEEDGVSTEHVQGNPSPRPDSTQERRWW